MNKSLSVHISGRVQGVGYRYFVLHTAQSLGLAGHVRNLRGGRVEVVAEGEEPALKLLLEKLKEGPAGASVIQVETKWQETKGDFTTFEVKF